MVDTTKRQRGLGRGLSALMADIEPVVNNVSSTSTELRVGAFAPIEKIHPNPDQPRRYFDANDLSDLADSIRSKGIIQPLLVRAHPG